MGENDIQSACQGALQAHYWRLKKKYTQFAPYSNQQAANSSRTNLFAADVIGIIEDSALLMLEMKHYDAYNQVLPRFCSAQHEELMALERDGVPISYCYNSHDDLEYYRQENQCWPEITLGQLKRSEPSALPDKYPVTEHHSTLFDWLINVETRASGGDNFGKFAKLLNDVLRPGQVRNQILVLLYSNKLQHLVGMNERGLKEFAHWIVHNPEAHGTAVKAKADQMKNLLSPKVQARVTAEISPPFPNNGLSMSMQYVADDSEDNNNGIRP